DLQALGFVAIAGALDQRHLVLARRAPGGPEIQQDRLAAVLAELDPAAVERLGGEVGRGLADSSVPAVEGDVDRRTLVEELGPNQEDQDGQQEGAQDLEAQRPGEPGVWSRADGGVQCDKSEPAAARANSPAR